MSNDKKYIYWATTEYHVGFHKIGCTTNIESRMKSYVTYSPVDWNFQYKEITGSGEAKDYENFVHKLLKKNRYRKDREWFFGLNDEIITKAINHVSQLGLENPKYNFYNEIKNELKLLPSLDDINNDKDFKNIVEYLKKMLFFYIKKLMSFHKK